MSTIRRRRRSWFAWLLRRSLGVFGAVAMTLGCFLVLPVIQAMANETKPDLELHSVDSAFLEPPPPPPEAEEEPEPEEEQPEEVPELDEGPPPDLSMLEMALGVGGGGFSGPALDLDFGLGEGNGDDSEALFSLAELDQAPRVLFSAELNLGEKERRLSKKQAHKVYLLFIVDTDGRVKNPRVQSSTHPAFESPALKAITKWRFEPGKREGESVSFRMRLPITFKKTD